MSPFTPTCNWSQGVKITEWAQQFATAERFWGLIFTLTGAQVMGSCCDNDTLQMISSLGHWAYTLSSLISPWLNKNYSCSFGAFKIWQSIEAIKDIYIVHHACSVNVAGLLAEFFFTFNGPKGDRVS